MAGLRPIARKQLWRSVYLRQARSGYSRSGRVLAWEQEPDGSSLPGNPLNEAIRFQGENHLVHRWRAHAEVSFHIGLGRGSAMDLVVVDEREILTLLVREGFHGRRSTLSDETECLPPNAD